MNVCSTDSLFEDDASSSSCATTPSGLIAEIDMLFDDCLVQVKSGEAYLLLPHPLEIITTQ